MPPKTREPIHTPRFEQDIERLKRDVGRLDELIAAIAEVLCRDSNMDRGRETHDKKVYGFPLMRLPGNPSAALYYSYTDTQVIFLYIVCETDFPQNAIM